MRRPDTVIILMIIALVVGVGGAAIAILARSTELALAATIAVVLLSASAVILRIPPATAAPAANNDKYIARRLGWGPKSIQGQLQRSIARDVGALLGLHQLVSLEGEPPPQGGWGAEPETLVALVGLVRDLPAGATIVELGSGISTVWMGLAAAQTGRDLRLVSLDHEAEFGRVTVDALRRQGLDDVEVRISPLEEVEIDGRRLPWYSLGDVRDVARIDLLFVDGPPASTADRAREPAFPLLADRLEPGAIVVLDDAGRAEEAAIVEAWTVAAVAGRRLVVERYAGRAVVLRVVSA